MWRNRWLALQDRAALALLAIGLVAAVLVVLRALQVMRLHWSFEIVAVITIAGGLRGTGSARGRPAKTPLS